MGVFAAGPHGDCRILPVTTLSIAIYVFSKSRSNSAVAPEIYYFVGLILKVNDWLQLPKATGLAQTTNELQQRAISILELASS